MLWLVPCGVCGVLVLRINGQLVALKEIRMKTEEGVPFTAIREGRETHKEKHLETLYTPIETHIDTQILLQSGNRNK